MKVWIIGLPNVGKSTLFNALVKSYTADVGNFPFCTIDPNVGIVNVKDDRILKLSELSNSKKTVPATIEFVDIAWLVRGASKWEWLWNKFLDNIKEVDAVVQVLRYFNDNDVWHVEWSVDPIRDVEIINTELIIADLEKLESIMGGMSKKFKFAQDKEITMLYPMLEKAKKMLEKWEMLNSHIDEFDEATIKAFKQYWLLTYKLFIYAINIWEDDICDAKEIIKKFETDLWHILIPVCAKLEFELLWLSDEAEINEYLESFDCNVISQVWLDNLITKAYDILWLMYFFTTWEIESKAWQIKKWSTAPQAAGKIHTDFELWFIKAETVSYDKMISAWSWSKARENWDVRIEWKNYIMQDGDVVLFRFNR